MTILMLESMMKIAMMKNMKEERNAVALCLKAPDQKWSSLRTVLMFMVLFLVWKLVECGPLVWNAVLMASTDQQLLESMLVLKEHILLLYQEAMKMMLI